MSTTDTKESLLDAAEHLFVENGIGSTSLRAITTAAGVNLAAVNYHFGSKEALVGAVFERRLRPLNQERLRLLDRCEAASDEDAPPLEAILRSFIAPAVTWTHEETEHGRDLRRLLGRAHFEVDDTIRTLLLDCFGPVIDRFTAALSRVLPDLGEEEILWRLFFVVGTLAMATANYNMIEGYSRGLCDPRDTTAVIERLVGFAAAGLRSPVSRAQEMITIESEG
jgi:AcrR family transcriptional regulator